MSTGTVLTDVSAGLFLRSIFVLECVSCLITVYLNVAYVWGTSLPRGLSLSRHPLSRCSGSTKIGFVEDHWGTCFSRVVRGEGGEGEIDN